METGWTSISASIYHSCGLGNDWLDITLEGTSACGIRENSDANSLWCWGSSIDSLTPVLTGTSTNLEGGWEKLAAESSLMIGIHDTAGTASWGLTIFGQRGDGLAWFELPTQLECF